MDVPPTSTATPHTLQPDDLPPPTYISPQTFNIGSRQISTPLVNSAQIKGHLALLHAFIELRTSIESYGQDGKSEISSLPATGDKRWVWFVGLAVERFKTWCESLTLQDSSKSATKFLPPLDVLMVWHAYMLNPGWFAEDCIRLPILQSLAEAGPIFSTALASGLPGLLTSEPTKERIDFWHSRTQRAFDALEDAQQHQTKTIQCPRCRTAIEIPFLNSDGTGYLQQDFSVKCSGSGCALSIGKDMLGLRKFVDDLVREDRGLRTYFAGTLRTPAFSIDTTRAQHVKDLILAGKSFQRPAGARHEAWVIAIMGKVWNDLKILRTEVHQTMRGKNETLADRILSAYVDDRPFSVDLVGAVIRQGSFVKKMHELKWTEPAFFDNREDDVALQHIIARYHGFLDLMSASKVSFHVPTLDIDLAWHTHQLAGEEYNIECMSHVQRYIDHDDKVAEAKLSSSFDLTSRAWHTRFGVPYTHCGCPIPGDTIGQRVSRLVHFYTTPPPNLVPPGTRPDLLAGTHPSEHNSVVFLNSYPQTCTDTQMHRRTKYSKRWARDAKHIHDAGVRAYKHEVAFLLPIPLAWSSYDEPECAAHDGRLDSGVGMGGGFAACGAPRTDAEGEPVTYSGPATYAAWVAAGGATCTSMVSVSGCSSGSGSGGDGGEVVAEAV